VCFVCGFRVCLNRFEISQVVASVVVHAKKGSSNDTLNDRNTSKFDSFACTFGTRLYFIDRCCFFKKKLALLCLLSRGAVPVPGIGVVVKT
jgi:hypothetical protein